jgi:hypothetical protein
MACFPRLPLLGLKETDGLGAEGQEIKPSEWVLWIAIAVGASYLLFYKPSKVERMLKGNPRKKKGRKR